MIPEETGSTAGAGAGAGAVGAGCGVVAAPGVAGGAVAARGGAAGVEAGTGVGAGAGAGDCAVWANTDVPDNIVPASNTVLTRANLEALIAITNPPKNA